ncbi:hypothetical protein PTKIN_Ptkin03bG0192100 [Pterospermum kingtungense]
MINETSHRKSFIESSVKTARLYDFHGLDLVGVVPGNSTNMTSLATFLDEWRAEVVSESKNSGKTQLLLTMMVRHMPIVNSVSYPIDSMKRNLDWMTIKAYDYYVPTRDSFTGVHAALYDPLGRANTDSGPAVTIDGSMGYKFIKSFILNYGYGVKSVYNSTYVVNFCKIGSNWINFDDVEAIKAKVSYAKAKGLLGYYVFQLANDENWVLSQAAYGIGTSREKQKLLVIVLVTVAVALIVTGTIICYLHTKIFKSEGLLSTVKISVSWIRTKISAVGEHDNGAHNIQVFSFTSIKAATNNFSSENKLGEGGYGPVYKGKLPKGEEIAVKRLSKSSNQGLEEFKNEVTLTASLQHVNLVRVLGICTEREEKILIYEFMPNKSLDFYLYDPVKRHLLDWRRRVKIIEGLIQGLLYLQEYSNFTIIHRDIKASNILLDDDMNPKISDFGMAKFFKKDELEANTSRIVGTYGYVPPEYVKKGTYSMKYDVYSFGVLLLQIISGKRNSCLYGCNENLNLLEYAYELWKQGRGAEFFDASLDDSSSPCKLITCMQVALLCVQENPADRPSMVEVFTILKNENKAQTWVKAGYWYANGEFPIQDIDSALFTHLSCAFAEVNPSTYQLSIPSDSDQYFSTFTSIVKRRNPSVKTLMSIWNGISATGKSIRGEKVNDSVLSSVVSKSSNSKSFIDSSIKTARRYGFHGIDLFWVWPNSTDLSSIGGLLDEWRAAINSEPRKPSESKLILTIGVRYLPTIDMVTYPIDSISRNVDWAHVVAYDYHIPTTENFTGLHAALYNPSSHVNTDYGIREWLNKGFPPSKLVLGLPYHGWAWKLVRSQDNGVGAPASGPAVNMDGSMGYKNIRSYIRDYGYGVVSVYNATYVVELFTSPTIWINFDGVETVKAKISYAKEKRLTGFIAFQLSNDENWSLSHAAQGGEDQENDKHLLLKIILPVSIVVVLGLAVAVLCYLRRRKFKSRGELVLRSIRSPRINRAAAEAFGSDASHLQVFRFAHIKAATNNFSSANKLGEGGFGPVYKGKLAGGEEIAVKRLSTTSTQGLEEFQNEVTLTARLQHVNLVRVLGYCIEEEENMLIYEYMPNKSLDLYLFDPIRRYMLDWAKRVHIIEGVTQGLLYLQEYSNITVIHRDLKASNILLDDDMNPKISDFGMAKLFNKDVFEANTGRIVGTYGYVPPEYVRKGIYSMKYDVYSFGVLLLQIISGKRNTCYYGPHESLSLLEYAYELWIDDRGTEFVDPLLDDSSSPCKIMRCMQIALLCVQQDPEDRPTMLEVFTMLKNGPMEAAIPKRPAFSVRTDKNYTGSTSASQQEMCSFNDPQISELVPR